MKKIISLIVVLAMALSCFGVTVLANDKLPECNASLLKGDELIVADDVTLDFAMTFGAIDTEETVKEALKKAGREDLIGFTDNCLIKPEKKDLIKKQNKNNTEKNNKVKIKNKKKIRSISKNKKYTKK